MTESLAGHAPEAIDSAGLCYPRCQFHNFPVASEHVLAQHCVLSYLDIRDLS